MAARAAVSLLCLLGTVSAQGYNTTSSTGATATTYSDGAMPTIAGVTYDIQTDTSYNGATLNLARKHKRASDPGLSACMSTCSQNVACVGTSYSTAAGCTYYSAIESGSEYDAPGVDFAKVESRVSGGTTSYLNNATATTAPTGYTTPGAGNLTSALSTGANNRTATAIPTGAYGNATTPLGATRSPTASKTGSVASGRTTSAAGPSATSHPSSIITFDGVEFLIEIDVTYAGILFDLEIIFAKRATDTLEDCLATCANNTACVGTAFDSITDTCAFYSQIVSGSRTADNGTTFATVINRPGTDDTGSETSAESLICPSYNGHVITSEQGVAFSIGCSEIIVGSTFDITSNSKRQADTGLPQTLSNCVDICASSDACLGTSFEIETETCTFYNSVRYTVVVDGVDSASRIATGSTVTTTVTSYAPTTVSTSTTTVVAGITTVTAGVFTTTVTALSTGVSTIPGNAAGSGSAYTTVTATVYTTTVSAAFPNGSGVATSVVPVTTTVYVGAVPSSAAAYNTGSGATSTVYVTVGSGSGATAVAAAASTVTVTSAVSYCPSDVTFTTVYN